MRKLTLVGIIGALLGASGCNTLRARQVANDAAALYKKGDLKGAAQKYEEAAALDPKIAAVHLNLGFTYLSFFSASPKSKEGNVAGGKALTEFQKYIELKQMIREGGTTCCKPLSIPIVTAMPSPTSNPKSIAIPLPSRRLRFSARLLPSPAASTMPSIGINGGSRSPPPIPMLT